MDDGEGSQREIARLFRVSLSLVSRRRRRRARGPRAPEPHGGGPTPVLGPDHRQRLGGLIKEPPHDTRDQRRQPGGFRCRLTTLWRARRRGRLTPKKKTRPADQRDRPDVPRKRRSFRRRGKRSEPKRLVFVDETGVTTAMTPSCGWAPRGQRAVGSAPGSGETVTVIAPLGRDGVRAPRAFGGSTDTGAFQSEVEPARVPELGAGDVGVGDNLTPPQAPAAGAAVERAGAWVLPLPPSSPDSTPIEERGSKVKQDLRQLAGRTKGGLYDARGAARRRGTAQDILGWFRQAGLCPTHG